MTEAHYPIDWNHFVYKNKRVRPFNSKFNAVKNRQKIKKTFIPNGSIYVFNYKILKKTRRYYHKNTFAYLMPHEKSVDIDNKLDFEIAVKAFQKKIMNVLVLGLGSIGLGNKNIKTFKSYANFFFKSKKYKLYAVVDPNPKKIETI